MNLMHTNTLEELIAGCRSGNRKAQEAIYHLYASKMLGVCARYAKDHQEAEDMLQVGFIRMFDKINSFKNEGSFEGWLRRIMVNTAIEFYRRSSKMYIVDMDEMDDQPSVEFPMHTLNVKDLMKIIQDLPPGYRMVFNMFAIEGYSHKEIAETMGITEGTSKSQLARARSILKTTINKMEESYGKAAR